MKVTATLTQEQCRTIIDAIMRAEHVDTGHDGEVYCEDVVSNPAYATLLACDARHFTKVSSIHDREARNILRAAGEHWTATRVRGRQSRCLTCEWIGPAHIDRVDMPRNRIWTRTEGGCEDKAAADANDHGKLISW